MIPQCGQLLILVELRISLLLGLLFLLLPSFIIYVCRIITLSTLFLSKATKASSGLLTRNINAVAERMRINRPVELLGT